MLYKAEQLLNIAPEIAVSLDGKTISVNEVHPLKVYVLTVVILSDKRTLVNAVQPLNMYPAIEVTPSPIVTVVRDVQPWKQSWGILVTPIGTVNSSIVEYWKIFEPMLVTPSCIVTVFKLLQL